MERFKSSKSKEANINNQIKAGEEPVGPTKSKKFKIAGLIVAVLLLIAGTSFAGYKYAKSESKDDAPAAEAPKESKTETEKRITIRDLVGPESGDYRVELPADWVTGSCADNPDIFFLAPTAELLGKCQTEYFGTVSISKIEGDQRRTEEYYAADDYYRSAAFTPVTIDSLPGYRVSYSIAMESELGYPPVGTFEYTYNLFDATDNVTYKIGYRQLPSDADYQANFVTIAESFDNL